MCDPVTAITVASTVASVASTVYSGNAARNEANYSAAVARNNAATSRQQAADAEDRGVREQMARGRAVAQARSQQIAAAAANGLDTTFGSPVDIATDTTVFGLQDQQTIRENAAREATGFEIQAQNFDEQGKAYKRQARDIAVSTVLQAGSTILSSAGQIKGMSPVKTGAGTGSKAAAFGASNVPPGMIMGAFG